MAITKWITIHVPFKRVEFTILKINNFIEDSPYSIQELTKRCKVLVNSNIEHGCIYMLFQLGQGMESFKIMGADVAAMLVAKLA